MSHGQYAKAKNNGAGVMPQRVQVQIPNVAACASYHCPNCMNNIFERAVRIFEISALLSPIGVAQPAEQEVLRCTHCGLAWEQTSLRKLTAKEREDLVAEMKAKQAALVAEKETTMQQQAAAGEVVETLPVPGSLAA
ncbi:hypothetical protein SBDP2_320006 [Syntrophobacter sp. SbD2]|nr:hypothetical protein SBDP2_320006 [Syntrophobacter sp. SbD2]